MLYASSPPKVIWLLGYSVISGLPRPPPLPPPYAFIIQSYSDIWQLFDFLNPPRCDFKSGSAFCELCKVRLPNLIVSKVVNFY